MTNTVRTSNVDSVVFVNRIREMVSFELGKEIKKDVFCLVKSVGREEVGGSLRSMPIVP